MTKELPPPPKRRKNLATAKGKHKKSIQKQKKKDPRLTKEEQEALDLKNEKARLKNKLTRVDKKLEQKKIEAAGNTYKEEVLAELEEDEETEILFKPNPGPQEEFLAADEDEVFYGGARGGGKTFSLIMDPLRYCSNGNFRGLLLRRTMPELRQIIAETKKIYSRVYKGAKFKTQENTWHFPSGATIEFGYAERLDDAERYRGQSYTWIGLDELPQHPTIEIYDMLKSSNRSADPSLRTYIRATGNPGSIGCVPYGRVWTETGWKDIQDVREGERVWSVDRHRNLTLKTVTKTHAYDFEGDLIKYSSKSMKFIATDNHRFPELIRDKKKGYERFELRPFTELSGQATLLRTVKWDAPEWPRFEVEEVEGRKRKLQQPKSLDAGSFAYLLGLYLAEGHVGHRDKSFTISQKKAHTRDAIECFLDYCGFSVCKTEDYFLIHSEKWYNVFKELGTVLDKHIPVYIKNADFFTLSSLLEGLMLGDGCWNKGKNSGTYYTSSEKLRDDVLELVLKLGYKVSYKGYEKTSEIDGREIKSTCPNYAISFSKNKSGGTELLTGNHRYNVDTETKRRSEIEKVTYSGQVYCLTVEDTESFIIEQDGCVWVSGNSQWVKEKFIDPAPVNTTFYEHSSLIDPRTKEVRETKRSLRYIPASVFDNPYLSMDDSYVSALAAMPEVKRQQMLYGNWDVIEDSAFPEFDKNTHVIEPFEIPREWFRFRAADWGYSSPFCCLWFAVDYDDNVYVYREYYGTKVVADQWAKNVAKLERKDKIHYGVLDGSTDQNRGESGPSIFEIINRELRNAGSIPFRFADRSPGSRAAGKQEVHKRLMLRRTGRVTEEGAPEEAPSLFIFDTCKNLIRTLPSLPIDPNDPEKVAKKGADDHAYDALHYGLRSRPITALQVVDMNRFRESNQYTPSDDIFGY